ncbi:MAG: T9SS type A sorting domain-containing protein [Crocinitomicaceae bacterium]|nr:T9SS type A sorting domain-containing protein [Crocinitomicaceae bacterium]
MSNYNYEVKLYYVDSDVQNGSLTEADLQPVKYSGNSWHQPAGLLNDFPDAIEQGSAFVFTASNFMVWGGLTTFSVFGGAGGSNQPLPVDLISFNGQCLGDVVGLNWSTASENNSAYFDVEKSQNGIDWSVIHSETAAGNSSAQIDYEYVDFEKTLGDVYYRLNQVDFDGNSEYYDPIQVNCGQIENVLMTFPNPSNENFTIALMNELLIGDVSAKLIDASGKVADQKELSVKPGMNHFPWSLASLQEGVYFILISGPEHVVTIKHVITK